MICQTDPFPLKTDTFKQQLNDGVIPWAKPVADTNITTDQLPLANRLAYLETFIQNLDVYIYYGDSIKPDDLYPACYIGATDTIGMPYPVQFFEPENKRAILDYYHTLLHEIGHWTGHPGRLNRKSSGSAIGTKAFAVEELTAELTSAFVLNRLHIIESPVPDKAAYLLKWQKIIAMFEGDIYSLTTAKLQAHKACDYLFELQNVPRG